MLGEVESKTLSNDDLPIPYQGFVILRKSVKIDELIGKRKLIYDKELGLLVFQRVG